MEVEGTAREVGLGGGGGGAKEGGGLVEAAGGEGGAPGSTGVAGGDVEMEGGGDGVGAGGSAGADMPRAVKTEGGAEGGAAVAPGDEGGVAVTDASPAEAHEGQAKPQADAEAEGGGAAKAISESQAEEGMQAEATPADGMQGTQAEGTQSEGGTQPKGAEAEATPAEGDGDAPAESESEEDAIARGLDACTADDASQLAVALATDLAALCALQVPPPLWPTLPPGRGGAWGALCEAFRCDRDGILAALRRAATVVQVRRVRLAGPAPESADPRERARAYQDALGRKRSGRGGAAAAGADGEPERPSGRSRDTGVDTPSVGQSAEFWSDLLLPRMAAWQAAEAEAERLLRGGAGDGEGGDGDGAGAGGGADDGRADGGLYTEEPTPRTAADVAPNGDDSPQQDTAYAAPR